MFEQAATKINRFLYKINESLTVTKQEFAYNSKSSNKAQKLPTYSDYSVDWSEKQTYLKTLICIEYWNIQEFLSGGGAKFIVMQISFVMLIFLLFFGTNFFWRGVSIV